MQLPVNYHNLTSVQRKEVREEYVRLQGGLCYHCGQPLDKPPIRTNQKITKRLFPPNFFKWPVHLHHDHRTGMTLGAVHNYCNAILWEYYGV